MKPFQVLGAAFLLLEGSLGLYYLVSPSSFYYFANGVCCVTAPSFIAILATPITWLMITGVNALAPLFPIIVQSPVTVMATEALFTFPFFIFAGFLLLEGESE